MKILTDTEREALITKLSEAPDDILLNAVAQMKEYYVNVKDDMKSLNGFVGIRFTETPKLTLGPEVTASIKAAPLEAGPVTPVSLVNLEPPGPSAARITTASKDAIMAKLLTPSTLEQINKFLQRGAGKIPETQMLLRRLWDQGLITFDGTVYGVKK